MSRAVTPTFQILTIFPQMFPGPLAHGVVGKAIERGDLRVEARDLREFADPPHRQVDDAPFGGGAGMVMKPEPLFRAVRAIKGEEPENPARVALLDPGGRRFDQSVARELASEPRLVMICGRYEGVDDRVRHHLVDDEISIGDYVLPGGELAAMVVVETVARLIPGVVGEPASVADESFEGACLDHPSFTRPADFEGMRVPEVLLSGDHAKIAAWRAREAMARTKANRPDLLGADPPEEGPRERREKEDARTRDDGTRR